MPRRDAVLFDLDGTLLYTLEDIDGSLNYALARHGWPGHSIAETRTFVGDGVGMLVRRALPPDAPEEARAGVLDDYLAHYAVHKNDRTVPYPGIGALLSELRARGISAAVVTNKSHGDAEAMIRAFFGEEIALVEGKKDGRPTKPAPDAVRDAMAALGTSAERTLFVGDSGVDAETARNARLDCVLVSWGYWDRERLENCGALAVIDRAEELLRYV